MNFKTFVTVGILSSSLWADAISKEDISAINSHLDAILILTRDGVPASGKINSNVIDIKKILSKISSDRVISENELAQLITSLQKTSGYQNQKAIMISKTDNLRFWSYQAKKVIATIIDPQDQLDAVSIFSPLLMDPQNIGQLVIQQGSTDTVLTKTYSETEMIDLSRRLKAAWPYKSQKIVLENRVAGSRFTMNQIDKIIAIIDMFNDKKEVATMLLPSVIDPQNIDMLFDTFWTEPDKAYINGLIKKKPMKYLPKMGNQETK